MRGPTSAKGTTRTPTAQVVRAGCQSSGITGSTVRTWLAGLHEAGEVRGTIIVGPPKTEAGRRVVTLPAVALEALAEHLDTYAMPGRDGLVFTNSGGSHIKRSHFSRWAWRPAVHRFGLDGLRFHDLRHTAATLAAAGATTKELMERIGHTSPGVALRYQHVMADCQAALAAALDLLVDRVADGR
jgi:integrase